jgi:hypothetical protein
MRACFLPTMTALALAHLGFLFVPAPASATTLPVSYTVDYKLLKAGAPDGTMLTVSLFENSDCTGSPVASQSVAVGAFSISELLKQFKPKGATTSPPQVARLNHTMTDVTLTGGADLFLTITGTGVTPVGGTCQAQIAAGPPGADGADGEPGPAGSFNCNIAEVFCSFSSSCVATCGAEEQVIAGGCACGQTNGASYILRSIPGEGPPDQWQCICSTSTSFITAYATCCRIAARLRTATAEVPVCEEPRKQWCPLRAARAS